MRDDIHYELGIKQDFFKDGGEIYINLLKTMELWECEIDD